MIFEAILQIIAELCLYFGLAGGVLQMVGDIGNLFIYILIFAAAEICCGFLRNSPGIRRFLPLGLLIPAAFLLPSGAAAVLSAPAVFLASFRAAGKMWRPDIVLVQGAMKMGLGLYLFISLMVAFGKQKEAFFASTVPLIILWLGLSIMVLRLDRCRGEKLTAAVYLMNASLPGIFCLGGILLGSSAVRQGVKACIGFIWGKVLAPVFLAIVFAISYYPAKLAEKLSGLVQQRAQDQEVPQVNLTDDNWQDQFLDMEQRELSELAPKILTAVAVLFFLALAMILIRKYISRESENNETASNIARFKAEDDGRGSRRRFHLKKDSAEQIRQTYRKYLQCCREENIPTDGSIASDVIKSRSEDTMGDENTAKLRQLWLPARYSDVESPEDDAREARAVLKEIKKTLALRDKKLKGQ